LIDGEMQAVSQHEGHIARFGQINPAARPQARLAPGLISVGIKKGITVDQSAHKGFLAGKESICP
jgi:hypothetical protein